MPVDQDKLRSPHKLAATLLVSAVLVTILVAGLIAAASLGRFSHGIILTTYFDRAAGLKSGAAVNVNGVTIGTVKSVTVTAAPERKKTPVQVTMEIKTKYLYTLHTDSLATLTSLGALADTVVDIDSEQAVGPPPQDGDEVKSLNMPSVLDLKAGQETVRRLNALEGRFNTVMDQFNSGKGTIGQFVSNPGLANQASATAAKVTQVTAELSNQDSTVGKLLNSHDLNDKFAALGSDMQSLSASSSRYTSGPLQANIASAESHANSLTASVNAGNGAAGILLKHPQQLTGTIAQASALASNYAKNPATGGNFAAGGATTLDLQKLQSETNALATMLRKNPTKYLTIEVRVF